MKTFKKILCTLLVVVMCLTSAPLQGFVGIDWPEINFGEWFGSEVSALGASGSCGKNITYIYDSTTGEVVISGTGEMMNYSSSGSPFYKSEITTVIIEDGITNIGDYVFNGCTSLKSINIANSVISIGKSSFEGCKSLSNLDIPDRITNIGNSAFYGCISLTNVIIPNSVTAIGAWAFSNCSNLTSITLSDSITKIEDCMFYGCEKLIRITMPENVTSIGGSAFYGCTSIDNIHIPNSVKSIGVFAFTNCESLDSIIIPDGVKNIGDHTFSNCKNLSSITIPNSMISINECAFNGCENLIKITIPNGITSIGVSAFSNCSSLTSITIPNSVTTIGHGAFSYCDSLVSVTLSDNITKIADAMFDGCENLINITIPNSVTSIGDGAFFACSSLANVTIPNSVISIGASAFSYYSSNKSISILNPECSIYDSIYTIRDATIYGYAGSTAQKYAEKYGRKFILIDGTNDGVVCTHNDVVEYKQENAGCVNSGFTEGRYCNSCKKWLTPRVEISARGHSYGDWTITTKPTCTDTGVKKQTCERCGDVITQIVEALGHSYGDWTITTNPTCTDIGVKKQTCERCGDVITQIVEALGHIWEDAICTSPKICSVCRVTEGESLGHTYGEWIVQKEATKDEDGLKIRICSICGDEEKQVINKLSTYSVGDIIQFGSYPQSEVKDAQTINALNILAPEWDNWTSYGYYSSGTGDYGTMKKGDWMRYVDIKYDGNKYRGVKFTKYRPYDTYGSSSNTYQDDNGYSTNTVYWFKFEPIDWRALDPTAGLVMCETIIDSQPYSNTVYYNRNVKEYFNDSSYNYYACDYETSSIRKWLNNDFYNTAFTDSEKKEINITTLNNDGYCTSVSITGYEKFDSGLTNDKIFLLSYNESRNSDFGFNSSGSDYDKARYAQGSNYAKCQGLWVYRSSGSVYNNNSYWNLRSPSDHSVYCCIVNYHGISYGGGTGVGHSGTGVRPALRCDLYKIVNANEGNNESPDAPTGTDTKITLLYGDNYKIYTGESVLRDAESDKIIPFALAAKLVSKTMTNENVLWESSDESILKISGTSGSKNYTDNSYNLSAGVKALKPGKVTVTVSCSDGAKESCTITVLGSDSYFEVESTTSGNSVPVGEFIPLQIKLIKNGKQTTTEKKYSLSFDNPEIFSVESASTRSDTNGAYFDLKLKAEEVGVTNLTISDSETGAYITVLLTANERMNVYYFNDVPLKQYQNDRLTNFYNYNGLCIDGFGYTKINGCYSVYMNAYNSKHHYGVAVAYDKNGQIYDFEIIEPFKELKTSFTENLVEAGLSIYDLFKLFGDKYYYTGESISKYTRVNLEVPEDGYLVITNNCAENELAYLVNAIEYLVNASLASVSIGIATIGAVEKNVLIKEISEHIVKDLIESNLIDTVKSFGASVAKNLSYKEINGSVAEFAEALKKTDIDLIKIIKDTLNLEFGISIVESVVWNILPTGAVVQYLYAFNDAGNSILQANDFAKSVNAPQIVLYPPFGDNEAYTSNGVIVNPEKELSPEYVLHSYVVARNSSIAIELDKIFQETSDNYKLYNVTLYKDGVESQPNGKIKVMIPIPKGYNRNSIEIFWYQENGILTSMNATVEGDYAVFYTDHLSYYIIAEVQRHSHSYDNVIRTEVSCVNNGSITFSCSCGDAYTEVIPSTGHSFSDGNSKCSTCSYDKSDDCKCKCHNTSFFTKIIWKITIFFNKILKKNKECACGIYHY